MHKVLTWQYIVVSDEYMKYPSLALITEYQETGEFGDCRIIIAQPHHLEAIAAANDANGAFRPVDGHLSAVPVRVTPGEGFEMISSYRTNIDVEKYRALGIPFEKKKES